MDWSTLETFLLVREAKADLTVQFMMQRFRRMEEMGLDFQAFAASPAAALLEGDRFLLRLRKGGASRDTVVNYTKNLKALSRFHGWKKDADWKILPGSKRAPQMYSYTELNALLRLPYGRSQQLRMWRGGMTAHLALGWRLGELARLEEPHLDPANHTVYLAYPEKGNPPRVLPVHHAFFDPNRAFMSWVRHRPIAKSNPDAIWTYTDRNDVAQVMTNHRLALELREAGRAVGVRANCQRGRPTCATAHMERGAKIAFVVHWLGHANYGTLASYLANLVDLGLSKHLRSPTWFYRTRGVTEPNQAARPQGEK